MLLKSLTQPASKDLKSSRYGDICRSHIFRAGVVMLISGLAMVYRVLTSVLAEGMPTVAFFVDFLGSFGSQVVQSFREVPDPRRHQSSLRRSWFRVFRVLPYKHVFDRRCSADCEG